MERRIEKIMDAVTIMIGFLAVVLLLAMTVFMIIVGVAALVSL